MNIIMHIITINGINGSIKTMIPFHYYIKRYTPYNISSFECSTQKNKLSDIIINLNNYINEIIKNKEDESIILIGHSYGGIVAKKIKHKNIKHIITISSPHHGAYMAYILNKVSWFAKIYFGQIYEDIIGLSKEDINNSITTISTSLIPYLNFDGMVFTNEMKYDGIKNHHINFSYHGFQWLDIRIWRLLLNEINNLIN